jgi:hypothetical protein
MVLRTVDFTLEGLATEEEALSMGYTVLVEV